MTESNHAALGRGLKLYTDAMRRLVKDRLSLVLKSNWWEYGVLDAMTTPQRTSLIRELARNPDVHRVDLLDAHHFVRVVTKNFDRVFEDVFRNFKQAQSWLLQVGETRNAWAHPRSGDMLADEVGHALYAMVQLLRPAQLPEAKEIEAIRRRVLGIAQCEAPVAVKAASVPSKGELPYWWQVCKPREGFKDPAHIDESLFAATLGGVFARSARNEYLDPERFLSQTYFTENLTQMVRDIASRMSGGQGPAVTEVQTPFGGGKTHALLTLYHLISSPEKALKVPGVAESLGDARIPHDARVLVFDGQEASSEPAMKEDGASVNALWGELAHQVGVGTYQKLVMDLDGRGEAPGNAIFRQVLEEASPCLILLDEIVSYLVKLRYSSVRRTQNLYRQTIQFLQETLQLASNVPGVCVLISLPKSRREFGGLDPEQLHKELSIMEELQPRADRVVSKRTPINDEDIYVLMQRRLFERVDHRAAERTARAYRQVYEKTPGLFDRAVSTPEYLDQQMAAYPLHPELIDVIYKKWSTAPDFPRTRATLQLLAGIVADQWTSKREAHAIQSAHVDLEQERIRTRIVSAAGSGGGFDGVVAADIVGGDAHAAMQDQNRGSDYARFHIARGVATTVLMHSFGGMERRGGTPQELRLGTVAPNVGPEYVTEVLGSLEETLWYVHREGDSLSFQTKPNIYRMIAQRADEQPESTVADRLRAEVDGVIGIATGLRVLPWAAGDGQVPDNPDPTIAVLDPKYAIGEPGSAGRSADEEKVRQLWDRVGGGLRRWRNALVLVAPDREFWSRAKDAVREVLAYESVVASAGRESIDLSNLEVRDLESRSRAKRDSLKTSVATAYRWVFYPDEHGLESASLSVPATTDEKIAQRVLQRLLDQDYGAPKVLPKMGAVYFNAKIAPRLWKDESDALDLAEAVRRFPQWTYLPILPNREETIRDCIREGVSQQLWAVAVGDVATSKYQELIEKPEGVDNLTTLFDGSASLVKGDMLQLIREELHPRGPERGDDEAESENGQAKIEEHDDTGRKIIDPVIPAPAKRLTRIRLNVDDLAVAKTNNLQPYLFRVLQEQDAGAEVSMTIEVTSNAGISQDVLDQRIVEAFDQLGISIKWNEGGHSR